MTSCFQVEIEQPTPAVWALKAAACWPVEISELGSDIFGCETLVGEAADLPCLGNVGEESLKRQQSPPAVDATVPIEAAEEDRVKRARGQRVRVAGEHM